MQNEASNSIEKKLEKVENCETVESAIENPAQQNSSPNF